MGTIEKRVRNGQLRWRVRYRGPDGRERNKSFARKVDAERYLTSIEHSKITGAYVDPSRAKITTGPWADQWLASQTHLKPSTRARYEGILSRHIRPRWGSTPLSQISHSDVQSWVSGLLLAPATVRYIHRVFSLLLELAVRDGRIPKNPAAGVRLPRAGQPEKRFLTPEQVHQLADTAAQYPIPEVGGQYRALVLTLAFCGLRWGEVAALRVKRVDPLRRRLTVAESVTEVSGRLVWGTPKSHAARSVPMPRFLAELLAERVAGKAADDLVFTTWRGRPLRNLNWRRDVFDRAAEDAGLDGLTPHELRHTAASLAVSAGANVKAVQRMLGHGSAAMTLDVYSGLFDDDLDGIASRLDALPGVAPARPTAQVIELPGARNRP
jgi:integrase